MLCAPAYVDVEKYRQILVLLPCILLGSHTGYLNVLYTEKNDQAGLLLPIGLGCGLIVSFTILAIWGSTALSFAAGSILLSSCVEKVLIAKKALFLSSSARSLVSIFLLLWVTSGQGLCGSQALDTFYYLYGSALVLYCCIGYLRVRDLLLLRFYWSSAEFLRLIRKGWAANAQSYLVLVYLILEREYIEVHYPDEIVKYSVSYALAQLFFVALSAIAFSFQMKVGEDLESYNLNTHRKVAGNILMLWLMMLLAAVALTSALSYMNPVYTGTLPSVLLLVGVAGGYFAFSAVSVIGLYTQKSHIALITLGAMLALRTSLDWIGLLSSIQYEAFLLLSGLLLFIAALFYEYVIRSTLSEQC
mgnify:CR=1 FL=1